MFVRVKGGMVIIEGNTGVREEKKRVETEREEREREKDRQRVRPTILHNLRVCFQVVDMKWCARG